MHTCHYCKFWNEVKSKLRRVESRNGRKYHYRFCREVGHEVQSDSEPCNSFRPNSFFWCNKDDNRMHVLSCLNRDCKCSQKEDVLDAIRGFDIGKEFGMKPRLVKRKVPVVKQKPKLKLRKKPILVKKKKKKLLLIKRVR